MCLKNTKTTFFRGDSIRIGFCVPPQTVTVEDSVLFRGVPEPAAAADLSELDSDSSKNYFFDKTKGIVYVKYSETNARGAEDYADCVGSYKVENCPYFRIRLSKADDVDYFDADCTSRGDIA